MASVLKNNTLQQMTRRQLVARLKLYRFQCPDPTVSFDAAVDQLIDAMPLVARKICNDLEAEAFFAEGGPLQHCNEWIELRRKLRAPSQKWG